MPSLSIFDRALDLIAESDWSYAILAGLVLLDADLPILPGETAIVTAAVAASQGDLMVWLVALAGIVGGMAGDNLSYWIGRRFARRVYFHLFTSESDRERFEWAEDVLRRHGSWMVAGVRFVPGGRTAITLAAGAAEMRWRTFLAADAAGVAIWAILYTALGYSGGEVFREQAWASLLVSLGVAGLIMGGGWAWFRFRREDD